MPFQGRLNIFTDQLGSVRVLALPDGRALRCVEYDSFGAVTADNRPEWNFPLGFACGLNDPWTGFVRFGYRDYDPRFGRFTAKDPARDLRGDGDLWDYCLDDPVGKFDPTGLWTENTGWVRSQNNPEKYNDPDKSVLEAALLSVPNFPSSAMNFYSNIGEAVASPRKTGNALLRTIKGIPATAFGYESENKPYSDAAWQFFKDRYGSTQRALNTLVEDPVGVMGDASALMNLGGGVARLAGTTARVAGASALPAAGNLVKQGVKLGGLLERGGKAVVKAGGRIDPILTAGRIVKPVFKKIPYSLPSWVTRLNTMKPLAGIAGSSLNNTAQMFGTIYSIPRPQEAEKP